jgi:alpha-L-arabinofuranosidase
VLLVDTDRVIGDVEEAIYGQFLEHINHSVEGLFAEQIQGRGFEGRDFETYWTPFGESGSAVIANVRFENGEKSVRLQADHGTAGIRQGRINILRGQRYNGSVWIKPEAGALRLTVRVVDSHGHEVAAAPLGTAGSAWQ